jgi:radical SAM superfamily enzyme YgiQ (UPF0313 family)
VALLSLPCHKFIPLPFCRYRWLYRDADKSLARLGRKQATETEILLFIYPIYYHNWRNISTIYIYITRLPSNEIFSPSNKIHREVGRAKDFSALRYMLCAPGGWKSVTCLRYCEGSHGMLHVWGYRLPFRKKYGSAARAGLRSWPTGLLGAPTYRGR